jgi:hypothetical protein
MSSVDAFWVLAIFFMPEPFSLSPMLSRTPVRSWGELLFSFSASPGVHFIAV